MSLRPRTGLRALGDGLRALLFPRPARRAAPALRLRGRLRQAVVVPTPDAVFSEAVFILRDEALREPGLDREALLREAARAAESYTESVLPARERPGLRPAAAFLLGAAATLALLWALGVI